MSNFNYKGRLFGKTGNKYFPTGITSDDYDNLQSQLTEANKKIEQLTEENENLKCCGNCKYCISFFTMGEDTIIGQRCNVTGEDKRHYDICSHWEIRQPNKRRKTMKIVEINGIEYIECYGKARGKSWTMIYYPLTGYKAQQPRKQKTQRQIIEDKCDTIWSEKVKEKWGNQCAICGKRTTLNSHHLITRSNKQTRWNIDNGICLCAEHHTLSSELSAHKTPQKFLEWLENNFKSVYENYLMLRMQKPQKQDMKLVYLYLKNWRNN